MKTRHPRTKLRSSVCLYISHIRKTRKNMHCTQSGTQKCTHRTLLNARVYHAKKPMSIQKSQDHFYFNIGKPYISYRYIMSEIVLKFQCHLKEKKQQSELILISFSSSGGNVECPP